MTLGIAIPTYIGHLKYLKEILDLLQNSTVKPNQVSISCSSLGDDYHINYENYDFEIIFTPTIEVKNPSQNRNIAASKLSTDIISFIDGDDYPHIQRNEFILKSFENNEVGSLVHNYHKSTHKDENFLRSHYPIMDLRVNHNNYLNDGCPTNLNGHIDYHHAHISIRKELFERFRYNEDENFKYREDSLYTKTLLENGFYISVISNKMSQYNKD